MEQEKRKQVYTVDAIGEITRPYDIVVMTEPGNSRTAGIQIGLIANGTKTGAQIFSLTEIANRQRMVEECRKNGQGDNWYERYLETAFTKPSCRPSHAYIKHEFKRPDMVDQDLFNQVVKAITNYLYTQGEK